MQLCPWCINSRCSASFPWCNDDDQPWPMKFVLQIIFSGKKRCVMKNTTIYLLWFGDFTVDSMLMPGFQKSSFAWMAGMACRFLRRFAVSSPLSLLVLAKNDGLQAWQLKKMIIIEMVWKKLKSPARPGQVGKCPRYYIAGWPDILSRFIQ